MSQISVDSVIPQSGTTITIGGSGDTVTLGSGASASGFTSGIVGVSTFTSSGTWTKATREAALGVTIKRVIVEVQGAGGGGGATTNTYTAGSGGAGAYARKLLDVTSITSATITVASGGSAGIRSPLTNGGNAGSTSWSDGVNTDVVGGGGYGGYSNNVTAYSIPGSGGIASGGDILINGQVGFNLYAFGGASFFGNPNQGNGRNSTYNGAGNTLATGYGTGGTGSNSADSEAGRDGIVIVWEIAG